MMVERRILVVEDDESIRESTKDLLESEGYVVECSKNGEEGIQALRRGGALPHLILLDLMMPGKDGFEFRRELEQDSRLAHIPVVIMTADGQVEEKKLRIGAKAYIRKPVDIEPFLEVVKRCL